MKPEKWIAIAFTLLLSAGAVTAQSKPDETLQPTTPGTSSQVMPIGNEREELEKLRQDKEIRDRVQSEVDRAFNRSTTLLNTLLFMLTLFPIAAAVAGWLLRRSIIYQIASETKNLLAQIKDEFENRLAAEVTANLKEQIESLKQEMETMKLDTYTQITNYISETQALLEELRQQKDFLIQEIEIIIYEQSSPTPNIVEREVEPPNDDVVGVLEIVSDVREVILEKEQIEALPSQVLTAKEYLDRGDVFLSERHYVEANASYNKAIEIDRNFPEARYQNARCYAMRGKANPAIGNLQWAIDLEEKYKEMAKSDSAFNIIRSEEQFKKIVND